jgi:hypothetical protein
MIMEAGEFEDETTLNKKVRKRMKQYYDYEESEAIKADEEPESQDQNKELEEADGSSP